MGPQPLQLRDIHLPDTISWWPPAIGWWGVMILIPLFCWLMVWSYKRITRKTAVKTAKKLLKNIRQDNDIDTLIALSELIRRVAMSQSPRAEAASLTGEAWLEYLDESVKGTPFTQGVGKVLANAHYQKQAATDLDIPAVTQLCETWLKAQK
ncbi:MAG: DUF4381 family protein [Methylomarinum sp.]|nr:DUF4381 family protein [Methylomarinum sp.]